MHRFNVDITNVSHGNYAVFADCSNSGVILCYTGGTISKPSHVQNYPGTLALSSYLNKFIPLD